MSQHDATVDGIDLFSDLASDERAAIAARCRWHRHGAGQQVVGHLDTSHDVFFVIAGRVRVLVHSRSGKQVSYRDIGPGQMFGEFAALDGEARSATVLALSDCLLASLDDKAFQEVVLEHPEVTLRLLRHLTRLVRFYSERVRELATLPVEIRVQLELLRLARPDGPTAAVIDPAPTHAELAERIGTHREAVTRALATLRRAGLLETGRGRLAIPDLQRLRERVAKADID